MVDYYKRTQESKNRRRQHEKDIVRMNRETALSKQRLSNQGAMDRTKVDAGIRNRALDMEQSQFQAGQREKALQAGSDEYYAREIAEGRLAPYHAVNMSEKGGALLAGMMGGGGAVGMSGNRSGGGSAGTFSPKDYQKEWTTVLGETDEMFNSGMPLDNKMLAPYGLTIGEDGKFYGAAGEIEGRELGVKQARNAIAAQKLKERLSPPGMGISVAGQGGDEPGLLQGTEEFNKQREARSLAEKQNLEQNLTTSLVDAAGRPVDASTVTRVQGKDHYGVTSDGTEAYQKFSLAGVGKELPDGGPEESSILSRGFGPGRQMLTGPSGAETVQRVLSDVIPAGQNEARQSVAGQKEDAVTGSKKKPEPVRGNRSKKTAESTIPKTITRQKLVEVASSEPKRPDRNPHEAIYGQRPWRPSPLADAVQTWAGQNQPEDAPKFGEDQIAFALRQAGLGKNLTELKQMSRNLRLKYPNASMDEIVGLIKKSTEKKG